jgi:hypothetical protein
MTTMSNRNENLGIIITELVAHKMLTVEERAQHKHRHNDAVSALLSNTTDHPPDMLDTLKGKSCGPASMLLAVLCGFRDESLEDFERYMSDPRYAAEIDVADARDEVAVEEIFDNLERQQAARDEAAMDRPF